jgi:hypothetical protein
MRVEILQTNQDQTWLPPKHELKEAGGSIDAGEAPFAEGVGTEWRNPIATPPQLIPRVFPGL